MAITAFDHLVIAVGDIEAGIATWQDSLGMTLSHRADVAEAGISQAFFTLLDNTFVELIAPLAGTDAANPSPLAGVLDSRGEGVHVMAFMVDDLDESVAALQARGVRLTGVGTPRVFIHPQSANGVLLQLWPKDRPHRWRDVPSESIET